MQQVWASHTEDSSSAIVIVIVTTGKLLFHIVKSIKSKIIYLNSETEGLQY